MADRAEQPKILRSLPTEMEAAILVAYLDSAGIDAWTEGGLSGGYRAEAPGNANVLVRSSDLSRARALLRSSEAPAPPASHPPTIPGRLPQKRKRQVLWAVLAWIILILIVLGVIGL